MTDLKKHLPENIPFNKNHVSFMGGDMGKALNRGYATMIMLDNESSMMPVIFERVQNSKIHHETKQSFARSLLMKALIQRNLTGLTKALQVMRWPIALTKLSRVLV